jgi:hypothetical protein
MKQLSSIIFIVFIISCNSQSKKSATIIPHIYPNNDTLYIDSITAVFYIPDTTRIAQQKKLVGEEDFYIGADDYSYYMHMSHEFLDSMKMCIRYSDNKKYLKFISQSTTKVIKLDTLPELWGIYFFDPAKHPIKVDMIEIDSEYHRYFSNTKN